MKVLGLFVVLAALVAGQEVRDAAAAAGYVFGSYVIVDAPEKPAFYGLHLGVATIPFYWSWATHINEGQYTWDIPEQSIGVADQYGMLLHGHPLAWGVDGNIPDWVKAKPLNQAQGILVDHITTVVTRYRGRVPVWDVVNEVVDDNGQYRECYWYRAMGINWVTIAFQAAANADPNARLLLNDYNLEWNAAKYAKTKELIQSLLNNGVKIDGLGWQAHLFLEEFERPEFAMDERMQEMTALGLYNYVTELDVPIPDNSWSTLQRQKVAYKTIAEIFMRNNPPGENVYFQIWDVADRYTWWDWFFPENAPYYPLPFDENLEKKPAYFGLVEAFSGEVSSTPSPSPPENDLPDPGEYRVQNDWTETYLWADGSNSGASVSMAVFSSADEQYWILEYGREQSYRISSKPSGNYLNDGGSGTLSLQPLNEEWRSMEWYFEGAYGEKYRLRNRWTGQYVNVDGAQTGVGMNDLNLNWGSMVWTFVSDQPEEPPGLELRLGDAQLQNLWTDKYLYANGNTDGATVSVRDTTNANRQTWVIEENPSGSGYRLWNRYSNLYLYDAPGFDVDQRTESSSSGLVWFAEDAGDGYIRLRGGLTDRYLNVREDQTALGMNDLVEEWTSMIWTVVSTGPPPPEEVELPLGEARIENAWTSLQMWSDGTADGASVSVRARRTSGRQLWFVEEGPSGSYRIRSKYSGNYLRDSGPYEVDQFTLDAGSDSMTWFAEDAGDGYVRLRGGSNGQYLNLQQDQTTVGQHPLNVDWGSMVWTVLLEPTPSPTPPPEEGIPVGVQVRFQNVWTSKYLFADRTGEASSVSVRIFRTWNKQKFVIEDGPNGMYRIRNVAGKRYLNDDGAGGANFFTLNENWASQVWQIEGNPDKYVLRNAWTQETLYVQSDRKVVGIYDPGTGSTKWGSLRWKITLV